MKEWINDNLPWILIVLCLVIIVVGAISFSSSETKKNKVCQDAGYVERVTVDGRQVCLGYTEGNKMIVIYFDDVVEEAQ